MFDAERFFDGGVSALPIALTPVVFSAQPQPVLFPQLEHV
jgi:hypothetical protein